MNGGDAVLAIVAGATGAPHCIVMCGGIGASLAMQARRSAAVSLFSYHGGRILTYGLTGAAMGAAGNFLETAGRMAGLRGLASILGGLLIIAWAWRRAALPLQVPALAQLGRRAAAGKPGLEPLAAFLSGLCLGLLPCGLTYAMQMKAAASGSWHDGLALLLLFGATTFPLLFLFALTARRMSRAWRTRLGSAGRGLAWLMGILSILKGCSANGWLPHLHPWLW